MADESPTFRSPASAQPPRGVQLDYAAASAEDLSLGARVADALLWLAAWMLALIVLGAICFIPAICESPGLTELLD